MKPSVTKLIGLLDKPALLKWANDQGLMGIKLNEYRTNVMKSGTALHSQIEQYLVNGTPFFDDVFFEAFKKFMQDKEVIAVEKQVENEYFQGRYDIKLKYNDLIYICDFKSNKKKVYLENKLQLVSYRMADNCDKIAVISIPDLKFTEIEISDFSPYENIMISLSNIYTLKNKIENDKL